MIHRFMLAILVGASACLAQAQEKPSPAEKKEPSPKTVIRLELRPAAASVPVLRYPLLPPLRDQRSGNAALVYLRAMNPENMTPFRRAEIIELMAKHEKSRELPEELAELLGALALRTLDEAARKDHCHWDRLDDLRRENLLMPIGETSALRNLSWFLCRRARVEYARGDFDAAVRTLQTAFALSRHIADGSCIIHGLVGIAIASECLAQLEDCIQTPGSPNFFWPLTTLPGPFISTRRGLEAEQVMIDGLFAGVREAMARRQPLSPSDRAALERSLGMAEKAGWLKQLDLAGLLLRDLAADRKWLLDQGWPAAAVDKLSPLESHAFRDHAYCEELFQEMIRLQSLPYWQASQACEEGQKRLEAERKSRGRRLVDDLGVSHRILEHQARLERRIAAIRCIEALRLHAALRAGKWPDRLSDIEAVPIPIDPMTGKEFEYRRDGNRAVLAAPPLANQESQARNRLEYELELIEK